MSLAQDSVPSRPLLLFFKRKIYFFNFICMSALPVCMLVYSCHPGVFGGQKWTLEPQEL